MAKKKKVVLCVTFGEALPKGLFDVMERQGCHIRFFPYKNINNIPRSKDADVVVFWSPQDWACDGIAKNLRGQAGLISTPIIILNPKVKRDISRGRRPDIKSMTPILESLAQSTGKQVVCMPLSSNKLRDDLCIVDLVHGEMEDVRKNPDIVIVGNSVLPQPKTELVSAQKETCSKTPNNGTVLFISDEPDDREVDGEFRRNDLILRRTDSIKVIDEDKSVLSQMRKASAVVIHRATDSRTSMLLSIIERNTRSDCRVVVLDPEIDRRMRSNDDVSSLGLNGLVCSGREVMIAKLPTRVWCDTGFDCTIDFLKGDVCEWSYDAAAIMFERGQRLYPPTEIASKWQAGFSQPSLS